MKKIILAIFSLILIMACKEEKKVENLIKEDVMREIKPISDAVLETAVIYEANIRQYSVSGHFDEFTKDIPQLKQLGVKIIWLMPVFPISETKRKATGGDDSKFASDFPEEEQSKYLGSYYAVTDFTKINPEFGTIEDFRNLIKTAHEHGMYVILDWVPNHTGWDHIWIKNNPEYYTQDENGNILHPKDTDWTDVADLNYDNKEMRKEMIADMQYWLKEEGVDGFRCDVAASVPTDFWEEAIPQLRKTKDIFMLAEAWEPELVQNDLFEMVYGWDTHHLMNDLAQGKKGLKAWKERLVQIDSLYEKGTIMMNFVTNHDENSWNGTIKERMKDAAPLMTAFSYVIPGMPLIYSGMEYDLDHRLKFFEKDSIPKTKQKMWPLLEKLGHLKNTNPALNGGKDPASYKDLKTTNDKVLAFQRSKNNSTVTFIGNFSAQEQSVNAPLKGSFTDYMTNEPIVMNENALVLKPWEYRILTE